MKILFPDTHKNISQKSIQEKTVIADNTAKEAKEKNKIYEIKNKTDRAEISGGHTGNLDDKKLLIAKSTMLNAIASNSPSLKIDELRARIESGSYRVSTDLLVDAILNGTNKTDTED